MDSERHLGHIFLENTLSNPDRICKIDAATEKQETFGSVRARSIQLAKCLRKMKLRPGNVMCLAGKNHLDLHIPLYAAMINGYPVVGVDPTYKMDEVTSLLKLTFPKVVFCDEEDVYMYEFAVSEVGIAATVVTYTGEKNGLSKFIEKYDDGTTADIEAASFDTVKIPAWLITTRGTSGTPKLACLGHKALVPRVNSLHAAYKKYEEDSKRTETVCLNLSPMQWLSGFVNAYAMPVFGITTVQTSAPATTEHVIDIINKYKPNLCTCNPPLVSSILKSEKPCDLTCFDYLLIGGSKSFQDTLVQLKARLRNDAIILEAYGQNEAAGVVPEANTNVPVAAENDVKPEQPETEIKKDATGTGESRLQGDLFTGFYYNTETPTNESITKDSDKTGDVLHFDENGNFFIVQRMKMLIKCKGSEIVPTELEQQIRSIEGVLDVGITSFPNTEDAEQTTGCVVRRPGCIITADDIKSLVTDKLTERKNQGGVVFVDKIPSTSTGKVHTR